MEYIKAEDDMRLPDRFDFDLRKPGTEEADGPTVVCMRDKKAGKVGISSQN
jgi:hypothetical protein